LRSQIYFGLSVFLLLNIRNLYGSMNWAY